MAEVEIAPWGTSWAWGGQAPQLYIFLFTMIMAVAVLLATALHALEAAAWAGAYFLLGAVSDAKSAARYSLKAMTTHGNESISLEQHWQMMGALEALNGMLLFGLTTAFLFGMIQEARQIHRRH
ncbi:MAG TPA: hypothetical protein VGF39_11805 [Stellaceae bacterium]